MIIALSGFDGSGKTTIAKALVKELSKRGEKTIYIHGYEFSFMHGLLRCLRGRGSLEDMVRRHDQRGAKKWYLWLWPYFLLVDFSIKIILYKMIFFKTIFVFDRYIYDYLLSCYYQGYRLPLRVMLAVVPRPDYSFYLRPGLEFSMNNRASEHDEDYFREISRLYDQYLPKAAIRLRTGVNGIDSDLNEIIEKVTVT